MSRIDQYNNNQWDYFGCSNFDCTSQNVYSGRKDVMTVIYRVFRLINIRL